MNDLTQDELDRLWFEEAERRSKALDAGELESLEAFAVIRSLRLRLRALPVPGSGDGE